MSLTFTLCYGIIRLKLTATFSTFQGNYIYREGRAGISVTDMLIAFAFACAVMVDLELFEKCVRFRSKFVVTARRLYVETAFGNELSGTQMQCVSSVAMPTLGRTDRDKRCAGALLLV